MKQSPLSMVLLSLILVTNLGIGAMLFLQSQKPQEPVLALPIITATPPAITSRNASAAIAPQLPTATVPLLPTVAPFCGRTGSLKILVVGSDANGGTIPPGADLVRVVKVDFEQKKIIVFAFPRDLWVNTPSLAAQRINATTLGRVYDYAYKAGQLENLGDDRPQVVNGTLAVAQTLNDNYELSPEHYVTIKLSNLPQMIDTLGGIIVNVPALLRTDRYVFRPGTQLLNGAMTASYIRYLDTTEWERISRQDLVLGALRQKLLSPAVLPSLPELLRLSSDSIVTSLGAEQIGSLACVLKESGNVQIVQDNVHADMVMAGPQPRSMLPNVKAVQDLLRQLTLIP